jgi:hypothetical protein
MAIRGWYFIISQSAAHKQAIPSSLLGNQAVAVTKLKKGSTGGLFWLHWRWGSALHTIWSGGSSSCRDHPDASRQLPTDSLSCSMANCSGSPLLATDCSAHAACECSHPSHQTGSCVMHVSPSCLGQWGRKASVPDCCHD